MTSKLTKKERAWIDDVQSVLDRCPSPGKFGYYTIGDNNIMIYDLRREVEIESELDSRRSSEWCTAVQATGTGFDAELVFPAGVLSTAG